LAAELVQPVEDPWLEALQDHAIGVLDLSICLGVCHDCPIHADVVIIVEPEELLAGELCAVVGDDEIWDPKAVDDVCEQEHYLLGLDLRDWSCLDPL
jgi:hypothetical protein